ncbi:hypothetical protein TRICI_003012 [Trichomonascus ciferrii]|uniref:Protein kinase domain-containing protein n=1 Tax=Trichomonascus ciferrii TaxID=44093 RepID=A0A642VB61_9ASCO|nr:hypothetical protein TRICI_003012 [Trichomonascus ciferrii]
MYGNSFRGEAHRALKLIKDEMPIDYWLRRMKITRLLYDHEVDELSSYGLELGELPLTLWEDESLNGLILQCIDKLSSRVRDTPLPCGSPSSWAQRVEQFEHHSDHMAVEYLKLAVIQIIGPILQIIEQMDKTLRKGCRVSFHDNHHIFNKPHMVVTYGRRQRPRCLIHTTKTDMNISYDKLIEALDNPKTNDSGTLQVLAHIQELYSAMLLNRVRYGAMTNCSQIIFVKTVFTPGNQHRLFISQPMDYDDSSRGFSTIGALTGLILTSLGYSPKLDTGDHAPPVKHEVLKQTPYGQKPIGLITISTKSPKYSSVGRTVRALYQQDDKVYSNVYAKITNHTRNKRGAQLLQTEYNAYSRLTELQGSIFPLVHAYGTILHTNRILVLENAGNPVDPLNVDDDTIKEMRVLIQELHNHQIVHNNISLNSFLRDEQENIKIIGFTHAIINALPEQCDRDWSALRKIIRHVKHIRGNLNTRI